MTCALVFGLKITVTGIIISVLCAQRNKPDGKTMDRDVGEKGLKRKICKRESKEGLNKCIYVAAAAAASVTSVMSNSIDP